MVMLLLEVQDHNWQATELNSLPKQTLKFRLQVVLNNIYYLSLKNK